ncbi:hypothetical protein CBL_20842 [Carabus blaptoides fortunei]
MMNSLNPPSSLNIHDNKSENWAFFKQKFNIFLVAAQKSDKTEDVKVALLLNLIGDDALRLFNTFKLRETDKNSLKAVMNAFEDYCSPRKNVVFNRFKFFKKTQEPGESFDQFHTELKSLAKNCDFGVNDCTIQEKLLRDANLQLEDVVEYCRAAEVSKEQLKVLHENSVDVIQQKKDGRITSTWKESVNLLLEEFFPRSEEAPEQVTQDEDTTHNVQNVPDAFTTDEIDNAMNKLKNKKSAVIVGFNPEIFRVKLITLLVVPDIECDLILGMDFRREMEIVPDLKRDEWQFSDVAPICVESGVISKSDLTHSSF